MISRTALEQATVVAMFSLSPPTSFATGPAGRLDLLDDLFETCCLPDDPFADVGGEAICSTVVTPKPAVDLRERLRTPEYFTNFETATEDVGIELFGAPWVAAGGCAGKGSKTTSLRANAPEHDLPSIGAAWHAAGKCTPCKFFRSRRGCKDGPQCAFCHHGHEELTCSDLRRMARRRGNGVAARGCRLPPGLLQPGAERGGVPICLR